MSRGLGPPGVHLQFARRITRTTTKGGAMMVGGVMMRQ
jgi:hypothetical protein